MSIIKVIVIDDDARVGQQAAEFLNENEIGEHVLVAEYGGGFDDGVLKLNNGQYDIAVIDVFRGDPAPDNNDLAGKDALERIKALIPINVVFYTGLPSRVEELKSDIVRVASKNAGAEELQREISVLVDSGVALIRQKLIGHTNDVLRDYYWDVLSGKPGLFRGAGTDPLLEYVLLRRLASTLNTAGMVRIFGKGISEESVHPLSFYIAPIADDRAIEIGDVFRRDDGLYFIALTPSCDVAQKKARYIQLASTSKLTDSEEYRLYATDREAHKGNLTARLKNSASVKGGGAKYHFLPSNPVADIPDLVADFENIQSIPIENPNEIATSLPGYRRVARIDHPFAEDMLARYVSHKNRPGAPEINIEQILTRINSQLDEAAAAGQNRLPL